MLCSLKENLQVNLKYKTTKLFISSECTFINKRSTANIKIINYKYTYKFTCSKYRSSTNEKHSCKLVVHLQVY